MKTLIFIALLWSVSTMAIYGQAGNEKIGVKDSVELVKAWNRFKKQLFLKDINALKSLSRKKVFGECLLLPIDANCSPFSSPNKLLSLFFEEMYSGCRGIILADKKKIVVYSSIKDKAMKIKYPTQFQIWFTNKSEPGFQFAFVFNKIAGKFKFAGLDRVP